MDVALKVQVSKAMAECIEPPPHATQQPSSSCPICSLLASAS
jgi:hypothetical protein